MLGMVSTRDIQGLSAPPLQFGFYLDSTRIDFVRTRHDKIGIGIQSELTYPPTEYDSIPIQVDLIGLCLALATVKHIHIHIILCAFMLEHKQ